MHTGRHAWLMCCLTPRMQEGRMLTAEDTDEEIDRMHELFAHMFNEEYPSEDISAADWLKQQVWSQTQIAFVQRIVHALCQEGRLHVC